MKYKFEYKEGKTIYPFPLPKSDIMLDLNKLEQKLDKALESETKESLTKFLENKRKRVKITEIDEDWGVIDEIFAEMAKDPWHVKLRRTIRVQYWFIQRTSLFEWLFVNIKHYLRK